MYKSYYIQALNDYRRARMQASIQELLARLRGHPEELELLSYDDVRHQLQALEKGSHKLEEIPLEKIVGSVGRYHDFTRKFLPKRTTDQNRWARVMANTIGLSGLPPIEVYKIGEVYFVKDGNHRVSVARQIGNKSIQAYVTEVGTKVNLTPDIKPDELIIKSEQVHFLEITQLDYSHPEADLTATKAGAYPTLLEHIQVHRHYLGIEQQREITFQEAASHWYQEVFLPVVNIIRRRKLLDDFPDRTATDLYLWAADHRAGLEREVGWDIGTEAAISDLSEKHSPEKKSSLRNVIRGMVKKVIPDVIEDGPPPGTWRKRLFSLTVREHLFSNLIVALDGSENAWDALQQAIVLAQLENCRILGLHVHSQGVPRDQEEHHQFEATYNDQCRNGGITEYNLLITEGEVSKVLCDQARFADLIVLSLNHPPGQEPIKRLGSGISALIRNCPVPILTVPGPPTTMQHLLLAYDGSIKAKEALYIAAYFGTQHQSTVNVLTSSVGINNPGEIQNQAREYLSPFPIKTNYILTDLNITEKISNMQQHKKIDLILIGGYGSRPLMDVMVGSVLDQVLREIQLPVLICR